jgi:hypothetical protein
MNRLLTISLLIFLFLSCKNDKKSELEFYAENQISFFDLRNGDWTKNTWIRKPENLKMVHESFKKFGYDKLENLIFKSNNEFLIQTTMYNRNYGGFDYVRIHSELLKSVPNRKLTHINP